MKVILAHDHFDQEHLDEVVAEMKVLGAPTIRVYETEIHNTYQAVEGCHRLRACEILGIEPNIIELDVDTLIEDVEGLDYEGSCNDLYLGCIGDFENYTIEF